jgi:hypothetical protein
MFTAAGLAVLLAGIGVAQAARVPPVVEREVVIPGPGASPPSRR